jgi:hypothetical protein
VIEIKVKTASDQSIAKSAEGMADQRVSASDGSFPTKLSTARDRSSKSLKNQ